mmetsp:Transcript_561/g.1145  ORF Transcript_561/g.1145 Transcript_561/m.1145 type:complete len:88 (-) Transcript_561:56-319(-)
MMTSHNNMELSSLKLGSQRPAWILSDQGLNSAAPHGLVARWPGWFLDGAAASLLNGSLVQLLLACLMLRLLLACSRAPLSSLTRSSP